MLLRTIDPWVFRTFGALVASAGLAVAWQVNRLYNLPTMPLIGEHSRIDTAFYFDSVRTGPDSVYARLSRPVREGGWSGLAMDTTDLTGRTFWAVNDRGLNVAHELGGRNDKVFAFPGYHQKVIRFRLEGDSIVILSTDSIRSLESDSVFTVGLVSTKAATGEVALRMDLVSGRVDTTPENRLAPVPHGYDFESLQRRGQSLFLGDEYGPFIVEVDIPTMRIRREWYPDRGFPPVLLKRRPNRGMEGMAITPSGKLVGLLQSPIFNQPAGGNTNATRDSRAIRMVWLDPSTGETREFVYESDLKGTGSTSRRGRDVRIGDMVALSDTRFLVIEHGEDRQPTPNYWIDIFEIDISNATNITGRRADGLIIDGMTVEQLGMTEGGLQAAGIRPVAKRLLVGDLIRNSVWTGHKPEGLTVVNDTTIAISNDNDYGMTDYDGDGIAHIQPADQIQSSVMYWNVPSLAARLADTSWSRNPAAFRLTLLHNNDGESRILPTGTGASIGGIDRFVSLVDTLRNRAIAQGRSVVVVNGGDNFLPGREWQASMDRDTALPTFDGTALDFIDYDAITLGNHDFNFGPDVLARFIRSFPRTQPPFLSSNLDFRAEPNLQALVESGHLRRSVVVERSGQRIGIVGAMTPTLRLISAPRRVVVDTAVAQAIQAQVDSLTAQGINKIIVVSHMQAVAIDTVLIKSLRNVDILVAAGGHELLANDTLRLLPGQDSLIRGAYPLRIRDADNRLVKVVTTSGDYRYLGQLDVDFDDSGRVIHVAATSGPRRTVGAPFPDAVQPNVEVTSSVVDSIRAHVARLDSIIIGRTTVRLQGTRSAIRTQPTNLGALSADAILWQARQLVSSYGFDSAEISLQNGGGIRIHSVIDTGALTMSRMFDIHPFGNRIAVLPALPVSRLKQVLERAVAFRPAEAGSHGHIGGATVTIDPRRTAQVVSSLGAITTEGQRVLHVVLDNGDTLIKWGQPVDPSRTVVLATVDFLARGGDGYPFSGLEIVNTHLPQHIVVRDYIQQALGGVVDSVRYPFDFVGRVVVDSSIEVGTRGTAVRPSVGLRRNPGLVVADLRLVSGGVVTLRLLDLRGREVARTVTGNLLAGSHAVALSTAGLGAGVYVLRVEAPGLNRALPVSLVR